MCLRIVVRCLTKQLPYLWAFKFLPQTLPLIFAEYPNKYLCTFLIIFQDKVLEIETSNSVQILVRILIQILLYSSYHLCLSIHLKMPQHWVLNIFKFKSLCHFEMPVLNVVFTYTSLITSELDFFFPFFIYSLAICIFSMINVLPIYLLVLIVFLSTELSNWLQPGFCWYIQKKPKNKFLHVYFIIGHFPELPYWIQDFGLPQDF